MSVLDLQGLGTRNASKGGGPSNLSLLACPGGGGSNLSVILCGGKKK